MNSTKCILSFVALLLLFTCLFVKDSYSSSVKQTNQNSQVVDSLKERKCCTNYTDIRKLIKNIEQIDIPQIKGEFETTDQYNKKIKSINDKNQNLTDSCYLFILDTKTGWAKYDADNQILRFGINVSSPIVLHREVVKSQYLGSNAFGIKKIIEKTDEEELCINSVEVKSKDLSPVDKFNNRFIVLDSLNVGVEEAKRLKNTYAILILVMPKKSNDGSKEFKFVNEKKLYTKPTIDSPFEENVKSKLLNAVVLEALIVDTSNGNVLQQKVFSKHRPCLDMYVIKELAE